jgi:tRNA-Thr(GGU) m(6)t(6)A37 methyltransferase TsaA
MTRITLTSLLIAGIHLCNLGAAEDTQQTTPQFKVRPIGHVKKSGDQTSIVLNKEFESGLFGLEGYSHIYVFWWFDRNDTPEKRAILQVHPMGNRDNPLTGVFATRSPVRPNLIALTLCKIVAVKDNVIQIEQTDAFDGTPVLDIKPFIPGYDTTEDAKMPEWLERARKQQPKRTDTMATGDHAGLHNVMQVSDRIYSGSEPHGEEGFASLEQMGIKTVVSVDGARPNVEVARKHDLRYVHVPIGYDGVPEQAGAALARLVKEADGPFYIHCHHGRHRGPAAAAVACIASGATQGEALKILEKAGTSKDYMGLWQDVEEYTPPAAGTDLPELVEIAEIESLAAAMAKIDRAYDNLKLCQEAKWSTPKNHPDLVPALQAFLVREGLRESGRHLTEGYDDQFKAWLTESEQAADGLGQAVLDGDLGKADKHFEALMRSCKQCHAEYRN